MLAAFLGHFCKKRGKDQIIFKKLKLKRLQEMRYAESGEQRALFDGFVRVTYAQRETVFITLWCGVNFFFPSTWLYFCDKWNGNSQPRIHKRTHYFCQDHHAYCSSVDPLLPCVCGSSEINKTSFDQLRNKQKKQMKNVIFYQICTGFVVLYFQVLWTCMLILSKNKM